MGLANVANVPGNWPELQEWSFSHMAHHRDINTAIQRLFGLLLPVYELDPINLTDPSDFAYQHQVMHNNQNIILSINGNDLIDVNWNDPEQLTAFVWMNFVEHQQAAQILEI